MLERARLPLVAILAMLTVAACATIEGTNTRAAPELRVGLAPDGPPFAWRDGDLQGMEVDFARELAASLGRPLRVRVLQWEDLIPALSAGEIDLIMSGMTITPARQVRLAFSDPYLRSGLLAIVRRQEVERFATPQKVLERAAALGVVAGTTGERFVRERVPSTSTLVYPTPTAAVTELLQNRIDAFVHDAPVVLWYVSGNEASLAPVLPPLNEEQLGWAMRQADEQLRTAVNAILARWRQDGTRDRILSRWVPYWTRLESEAAKTGR